MEQIIKIIETLKDEYIERYKPASDGLIKMCESEFSYTLPSDFVDFLKFSNGIVIDGDEVLGIDNKKIDIIATCEREHREVIIPMWKHIIPFSPDGGGNYYCFDTHQNNIVFWQSNFDYLKNNKLPEVTHNTFVDWFLEVMIEWVIENNGEDIFR